MTIWILNHYALPPSLGGLNRHYYFSKYLTQMGHTVKIVTSARIHNSDVNMIEDKSQFIIKQVEDVEYTFVESLGYRGNGLRRIANLFHFPFAMARTVKHLPPPDIIYTSSPDIFTAFAALRIAKKEKKPCVVEIRDLWPESIVEYTKYSKSNPVIKFLYYLELSIYRKANGLIFTMERAWDYIESQGWSHNIDKNKVYHLNNGVDITEFDNNCKKYQLDDEDLINPDTFKVVYTGSIRTVNHLDPIIEAARILDKESSNIRFLLYGDGDKRKSLEEYTQSHNIKNIVFKGHVDKKYIPYILSKSDLNLNHYKASSITKYGTSHNKMFDYFASGRPILLDIKIGNSLVDRYNAGITVLSQEPRLLASTILEISLMEPAQYDEYCKNSRLAAQDFDYPKLAHDLETILKNVVEGK